LGLLLLPELQDARAPVHDQLAEAGRGRHAGDGGQAAVGQVERDQGVQVDVRDAVAVGTEEVGGTDVTLHAPDAGAGHGGAARRGAGDLPGDDVLQTGDDDGRRAAEGDGEVVVVGVVIQEVVANHLALVAEAEHEAVEPVGGEVGHDVPQDGPPADL